MLITGLVCGLHLHRKPLTLSCNCSLRNHRSHYTTFSVNVNSFEVFFSSGEPKKSDHRKIKSHFLCNLHLLFSFSLLNQMKKAALLVSNLPKPKSFLFDFVQLIFLAKYIFYTSNPRKNAI